MRKIKADGTAAFQGDVMFRRVDALPAGAVAQPSTRDGTVIAHSETGHHHVATGGEHVLWAVPGDPMRAYLAAKGPVVITHHRSTDPHEAFELYSEGPEVVWEIGRQREYLPEGWRRVED